MIRHGRARRRQGRKMASLAALLALVVLVAGVWITGERGPASPPQMAATGSDGSLSGSSIPSQGRPPGTSTPSRSRPPSGQRPGSAQPAGLRLRAGRAQQPAPPVAVVDGQPLGNDRVAAILDRYLSSQTRHGCSVHFS